MRTRLLHFWAVLVSSLWFIPALMVSAAVALSFATLELDFELSDKAVAQAGWIWSGGPEGAREILATIAGSMMTVTGVVFSITVVVLVLASSQFGPRLLRNFLRDTGNKVVLGTFIATFTYCLLILRAIRTEDGTQFAAALSVTMAIVLALVSLAVLIYFIQHVSSSIQAPIVIARVSDGLDEAIERLFPEKLGQEVPSQTPSDREAALACGGRQACTIAATGSGYLQAVDREGLMKSASGGDVIIELQYRPGQFITAGADLVRFWHTQPAAPDIAGELNSHFFLGAERTEEQDLEFAVHQLVEVALRALSPGINDPFTAINCVDRLGAALHRLAEREIPSPYRYDSAGQLRVIAPVVSFPDVMDAAFNQIRQYGRSSASVTIRLLETLAVLARRVRREEDRLAVARHATMIENGSREALPEPRDRKDVEKRYRAVLLALERDECRPH
jgi:uncharacterized membrane protein